MSARAFLTPFPSSPFFHFAPRASRCFWRGRPSLRCICLRGVMIDLEDLGAARQRPLPRPLRLHLAIRTDALPRCSMLTCLRISPNIEAAAETLLASEASS